MLKKKQIFSEGGFSLVEYLLVVVIMGSIVLLIANIPNALVLVSESKHLSLAREIAVKQIEDKRTINYDNLTTGSLPVSDPRLSLLPQGSGTVVVGKETEPGVWINCDPAICTNGEHLKQIMVTISWINNNKTQTTTLNAMIGEGGINQ